MNRVMNALIPTGLVTGSNIAASRTFARDSFSIRRIALRYLSERDRSSQGLVALNGSPAQRLSHRADGAIAYGKDCVLSTFQAVSANFADAFPYTARWPPLVVVQRLTVVLFEHDEYVWHSEFAGSVAAEPVH